MTSRSTTPVGWPRWAWQGPLGLVTDALAASGCPGGHYQFGDVERRHRWDGPSHGWHSGRVDRHAHRRGPARLDVGVPLEFAINAATRTPASLFPGQGIGMLRPGDPADLLVLDDTLTAHTVLHHGATLDPERA